MAPRERGRPGFSRRARNRIFTGYVLAVLGAFTGMGLLTTAVAEPASFGTLRAGAAEAAAPVGEISAGTRRAGQGLFGIVSAYFAAGSQNLDLRRQLAAARARRLELQGIAQENRRLKALLGIADGGRRPVTGARLIGSTASSTRRMALLSAGSSDGVRPAMPVRTASGLVGRVLEVGPGTSRVLLVTDPENVVPVRRARDGVAGFSTGRADGRLVIKLLDVGVNPLRNGDVFVTSGAGGIYPPNVPVAVVQSITPDGAIAYLVQDPATAEFVVVEPAFQAAVAPR